MYHKQQHSDQSVLQVFELVEKLNVSNTHSQHHLPVQQNSH